MGLILFQWVTLSRLRLVFAVTYSEGRLCGILITSSLSLVVGHCLQPDARLRT